MNRGFGVRLTGDGETLGRETTSAQSLTAHLLYLVGIQSGEQ